MAQRGVNKAIVIGNLGVDPDIKHLPNGGQVTNIRVATSEQWKDKQTGEDRENTEWHRIVFFGKLAEIAGEFLKKGSQVYVEGRLQTRKWTDKEGIERYTTEIVGNEMQMLRGRPDAKGGQRSSAGGQSVSQKGDQPDRPKQEVASAGSPPGEGEDDIPFDFLRGPVALVI